MADIISYRSKISTNFISFYQSFSDSQKLKATRNLKCDFIWNVFFLTHVDYLSICEKNTVRACSCMSNEPICLSKESGRRRVVAAGIILGPLFHFSNINGEIRYLICTSIMLKRHPQRSVILAKVALFCRYFCTLFAAVYQLLGLSDNGSLVSNVPSTFLLAYFHQSDRYVFF